MKKTTMAGIAVTVVVAMAAGYLLYDLNGDSLDFSDREMRLIITGSMDGGETDYPISTIPVYSLVMIEHLDRDELDRLVPGDVLAFRLDDMLVVHRILSVDPDAERFVTKGDANISSEIVDFENAVGEVVGVNPALGKIVHLIQTNFVFILVAVVAVWGLSWSIKQILKNRNSRKEEIE